MPTVLFVHNGWPGRFTPVAQALLAKGWSGALINETTGQNIPGIKTLQWKTPRGSTPGVFAPAVRAEADLIRGRAAAQCALQLQADGFAPDLIIGHPGWGEMTFLRDIFPKAPQIQIGEFYYLSSGADFDFDPEFGAPTADARFRVHAKNAVLALSYLGADRIVAPTPFQASVLPEQLKPRVRVIHEGVDTSQARRIDQAALRLGDVTLDRSTPVVTFINRRFEPLRGFHIFMRALPDFLEARPDAHVLVIGADQAGGYGTPAPAGKTWKAVLLEEVGARLDAKRVHWLGRVDYPQLLAALSLSWAHVYLTYPFVLSWSLLDAMACEALLIASDTAPVRDVIVDGQNGLLTSFFDHKALAEKMAAACADPRRFDPLRRAARESVVRNYDRDTVCNPAWLKLIEETLALRG